MHIQQIRHVRKEITDSDGKTRTVAEIEPVTDAETLNHGGKNYFTQGNGVFNVPDALGESLLGGAFRKVGDSMPVQRARVELAEQNAASQPSIAEVAAEERESVVNAAAEPEGTPEAKKAARVVKKARSTTKKA